ncbi:MAG TPA: hypothetical protein V6C81_17155 [Planktothrix sp.]
MTNAQAVTANADDAVVEKPVNPYSNYIFEAKTSQAKTSRNSSRRATNHFVPPPAPYTPSMVPAALGMTNAGAVTVNPYSQYIFMRNQGEMSQVVQPKPYVSYNPLVETRIQKDIDHIDSEISSHEKEIGKLLNL